ncbi:cell division protein ZipA [Chromohalobacter canadensis]|uniref:cell division protein ZipA n=1 Tax=Chromohalobacter canadensis TaxID=141389 RepID=UPI0021C195E5|nr:cell division protein ZipA [Chromohalobacter canadensis]MCT8467189.1 cell division protein ZipA [Chromohalobacter canadensis]MCT8471063.1 cell division protein ZipA [Chromohalobacter canadensis]MCT8497686.1 cell division protein ZipA [Chromohalobacter canadensis]
MELREWLIILGLVLVTTIVIDGVRRLQRQRRVPRLDQAAHSQVSEGRDAEEEDPEKAAREAEVRRELPNGGARVVRDATFDRSEEREPVRPESPLRQERIPEEKLKPSVLKRGRGSAYEGNAHRDDDAQEGKRSGMQGMKDAVRAGAQRMSASAQRFTASRDHDDERVTDEHPHHEPTLESSSAREPAPDSARADAARPAMDETPRRRREEAPTRRAMSDEPPAARATDEEAEEPMRAEEPARAEERTAHREVVTDHPAVERAKRNPVHADRAREALSDAEEVIVISVLSRDEAGFQGPDLLNLMLACGLRYCHEMGVFHRFETESDDSALQFTMVNVLKPGVFDLDDMDEFATPGVTFLMPLPSAHDSAAAFEAMFETAMVLVRNLSGELKDENRSVMTAQTVEFARQRVQEFERRHRLHRYQAN